MKFFGTAFLLVLLSIITNAARTPQYVNPCSMKCSHEEDNIFKPGQKYIFSYEGESNIKTMKGSYETTGVMIKSKVIIQGLSNCEMKLSLSDVQILDKTSKDGNTFQESPNSDKFKSILELNDVFFTKESNEIKSVCMDKDEPIWSENIKKAILDSLANQGIQTKPNTFKKTSHGKCFIKSSDKTSVPSNPNSANFEYDLQNCDNKQFSKSLFADISRAMIFSTSKVSCKYLYKDKSNLISIQCREEYKTATIKTNDNQMVVEITTNILKENQIQTSNSDFSSKNLIETGIEQAQDEMQIEESTYTTVKQTLKEICGQYKSSESSKIPKMFMELVNQLKDLNPKEFKEVYLDIQKVDVCPGKESEMKSIFYDASGFVNTQASTSVMVDLIKTNQISLFDQNIWLTSLSFMQETPTIEMLKELETILSVENPSTPLYLSLSALTHLYCKQNLNLCITDPTINSIVSKFLHNLNGDCSIPKGATDEYVTKIQISLKAIGNLKFYPENIVHTLNKCISKDTNKLSIKISALQVMKHMDCKKDRTNAMNILLNNENDSELRINAYLTVMGCSDINTLFKVREILSKEKVNQVGSFIWTHLTNLKESDDVLKADIKELLADVNLKKEFDISKLKFSRNIEKTFMAKNYGMNFDSNVIFSEKSFVPRSVSLNTTVSIFDKSTNFLDMSARLEGLEDLLFKLFGPEGYLKKKTSAKDDLELINMLNEMSGSVNIKLFGNQVSFIQLLRGSLRSVKKYNIIEEIMNWSQDKSFDLNKNLQLIDKTVVIPTLLGFPLKFKLQGSATINIKIKSKFDVAGLVNWPISMNINSYISPNINAELNSDIVYQTPFANYGMRLKLKSGTNTELKATILAKKNEEFSIKFDTPKTTQNILSMEGNAYVIHRNKEIIQLQDKLKEVKLCTSTMMVRILGIKICGEAKLLDSSARKDALLFGPFSANIFIKKEDTQTSYILQAFSKTSTFISQNGRKYTNRNIKFEFNTPHSQIFNRRFYGELAMDFQQQTFKLELVTPWNEALLATKFKLTDDEKRIEFNLKIDKREIFEISAEHSQFSSTKRSNVRGGISVKVLNLTPIKTKYILEMTNDEYMLNLISKGLLKEDTQLKINVQRIKSVRQLSLFNKYEISGFYNTYFGNGKISGIASENYYGHRWDIKIKHKNKNLKEYQFIFRHKTEDKSSKNLNKYFLTTTFAYGEKAENSINFKTENELSDKHIRTSIKANYAQKETPNRKAYEEELSMQLYGGYTWKNDNRHYAEGSLSFKFPSKNLYYEGRYNSEIGKKLFKLSLALDKDQQSKLNLKINYLQPKLYLKDTDFDFVFSLPYQNFDLKWKLMEIDVNKYKYTLDSKYNTYDMKMDGVHTQISKLDHDSYISIKMPRINGLPKDVKIKLRMNLVNLEKAKIQGELEIPNTSYKYSIDTEFSYIPSNFLQISSSEINSVFKYNFEIFSKQRLVKSKFIFTCNPEEFQTYFNVNFNENSNFDDQIEFDIHALHKNPVYKQFNSVARLAIRYPGNSHSIGFKSEFKYTEMLAQIDLLWNKNQRISIISTYELDNSWTQKGFTASLTVKTPFIGYEQTHFGMNAVGQLRYRKVNFECKWSGNKKLIFDIVIQPRSSNDFSLNAKLTSPFKGWNLVTFQVKHLHTQNSINTQCVMEIGPTKRYQLKFDAINNSEGKNRDFMSNILIESGIYPSFKMSILHKDDSVHYKSQFDALWMKTQSINVKSDISYTLEDYELITKGTVELFSTIKVVKQMKMVWSVENRDSQFLQDINLQHNNKNLFQSSIKGFYENEADSFKMEFNGIASVMNGRSMKIANNFNFDNQPSIQNQFSISQDTNTIYSHNLSGNKKTLKLKLLIPNIKSKTVEIEYNVNSKEYSSEKNLFVKINEIYLLKIEHQGTIERKNTDETKMKYTSKFMSDYLSMKNFESKTEIKSKIQSFEIDFKLKSEDVVLLTVSTEVTKEKQKKKIQLSVNSKYEPLKQLKFDLEHIWKDYDNSYSNSLDFSLNDILNFYFKTAIRDYQMIKIEAMLKKRDYMKYLKVKHAQHLLGYEDMIDTNIFGDKFKFTNTIISRGGLSLQTKLQANFWFMKSIEIFGRFSKEQELKIFYQIGKDSKKNEKIKLIFSNFNGINKFTIDAASIFQLEFKLDRKQFKTVLFDLKMIPNTEDSTVKFKFNYEGGKNAMKHSSELKFSVGDRKFQIENKIDKVKWNYLLFETDLKTNYNNLNNYIIGLEYKLRPSKYSADVKLFFNDKFIKLSSELDSSFGSKAELKIETSFAALKEISFELKHKQNSLLTQVTHKCKVLIKSHENFLKFQNEIEWSGFNYIKFESSFSGKFSDNRNLIQPKTLKFLHQFHKNVIKHNFLLSMAENSHFKFQLEVPLNKKSKSLFELESSFRNLQQLSVDFNMNLSENEEKSVSIKITKNNEITLDMESKLKTQEKLILMTLNLETSGNFKSGLMIELSENNFGTKIAKGKFDSSLLTESIVLIAKANLQKKELSLTLTGATVQHVSIHGKVSQDQNLLKVTYGMHKFDFEILMDKIDGIKLIKTSLSSVVKMDLELIRSSKYFNLKGSFEKNSLQFSYNYKGEFKFDFNIKRTSGAVKINQLITENNINYKIEGKSNIPEWATMNTEFDFTKSPKSCIIIFQIKKENIEVIKLNFENKYSQSVTFTYSSIDKMFQTGKFEINYEKFPEKLIMKLDGKNSISQPIVAEYNLNENSFTGKLTSPFEWFRSISIKGQLIKSINQVKGNFQINHNKLQKPIVGEITVKREFNLFKVELKTPFSSPYNQISFRNEKSNSISLIELTNTENEIFSYKLNTNSKSKFDINVSLRIPKPISDIKLSCSSNFDFENPTKKMKFLLKSNQFSDTSFNLNYNLDQNEYKFQFSHPKKDGLFELKISQYQESGNQIELLTQLGDMKHEAEIVYEIKNPNDVYFKSIVKCISHFSSPTSFEINYKHKFNMPNYFSVDTQFRFNDKTVLYKTISWKLQSDYSFELVGKVIVSPQTKEYENKFELFNKRGEIIELAISATEILREEIKVRIVRKDENLEFSLKTPFEYIKSVIFMIQKELKLNSWSQKVTFITNTWGKYESISEYKMLSNIEIELSNQINTPTVTKKLYTQITFKNLENDQVITGQMEFNSETYQISLSRKNQQVQIKLNFPFEYLRKFEISFKEKSNFYELESLYNQYQMKMILSQNQEITSFTIQSNTEYFKVVSLSIENSMTDKSDKSIKIKVKMDEKYFKIDFEINPNRQYLKFKSENDLLNYLPKSFSGLIHLSLTPIDMAMELKINENTPLNFIVNKDQILFSFKRNSNNIFSVEISKKVKNQLEAKIKLDNHEYSMKTSIDNSHEKFKFSLIAYKNGVNKLIEITNEIGKINKNIDLEIGYLSQTVFKFKFTNEKLPIKKLSFEIRLFSLVGVTDLIFQRKSSEMDLKLSWNFLLNEKQLHIGSIIYAIKSSTPINYLVVINLQNSYKVQFLETENGEFQFQISSPFTSFDFELKYQLERKSDIYGFWATWKNSLTGEYTIKYQAKINEDPEIKFLLSSLNPIVHFKWKMITSVVNTVSINSEFQFSDWEKLSFDFKLSTKDLIELIAAIRTPFKAIKNIQIKKNLKYVSLFEQKFETNIVYNGFMNVKYIGGHEIKLSERIFKFQGSFHNDETKLIALNINHSGNHKEIDHSFIWHIKEQKFGLKFNGGFKPMFEGKSEIYTPFHESGKIVLMGKHMERGIMFEAGNKNERLGSFEYIKENDVQLIKITPPTNYGKSLSVKYSSRRLKRSVGSDIETEILYGVDKLLDLTSKIEMKNDEYNALINLKMPKFTEKSAELSMKHSYRDNSWNFDHKLTVKDSLLKVYRLFGNLFRENIRNFRVSLNTDHPTFGTMHVSLGRSWIPNNYEHHVLMKSNDKTWVTHNGKIKYNFDEPSFSTEWKTGLHSKHFSVKASHSGAWKKFLQNLIMEYNFIPYLIYKSHVIPSEQSEIEFNFPQISSSKMKVIINSEKNKIDLIYEIKSDKYVLEMINKLGQFESYANLNGKNIGSLLIKYDSLQLHINGKYLKQFCTIEIALKKSSISLVIESSNTKIKKLEMMLSINKMMMGIDYLGTPYSMEAEYNYTPNSINIKINTSVKKLSKLTLSIQPKQIKFELNEFHQQFDFIFTQHHLKFLSKNNFLPVQNFLCEILIENPNKAMWKLNINSFNTVSKIEFANEKFLFENRNNYFDIHSIDLEILRQIEKDLSHLTLLLSTNKVKTLKLQIQNKNLHYSVGLETNLGEHLVASYNVPLKELIVSLKFKENYLNIIQKFEKISKGSSDTIRYDTTIESSYVYLHRFTNDLSYTTSDSSYYLKSISEFNNRKFEFKGEVSKTKLFAHLRCENYEYNVRMIKTNEDKLNIEMTIPNHKMKMTLEQGKDKYSANIQCNDKDILIIRVKQNSNIKTSIEHESIVEFYGRQVWNFNFKTNFKKYEIKMMAPKKFDLFVTKDWNKNEKSQLGFLIKYLLNGKSTEFGVGLNFLSTSQSSSVEIQMENKYHIIKLKETIDIENGKQLVTGLVNKKTKDSWEMIVTMIKDKKFELEWKTPSISKKIRYNQNVVNNVRTSIDLDVFDSLKLMLKTDETNTNLWTGSLSLFSVKIAVIEVGKDYVQATINKDGTENNRIFFKWTSLSQGEWKKDFSRTRQLIIVQKSLNINVDIIQKTIMKSTVYSTITTMNYQLIDGSMKTLKLGASIDFSETNKIVIDLPNPFLPVKTILVRSQPNKSTLKYQIESYLYQDKKVHGYFEIKTGYNPGLMTRFYYNPLDESEFFHMHCKFIDDRQMETIIYKEKSQTQTTYFQLLLRLLNEHHIESTFALKMDTVSQALKTIYQFKRKLESNFVDFMLNEIKWITNETKNRYNQLMNKIPNSKTIEDQLIIVFRKVKIEINSFSKEVDEMMSKNEFFLQTMSKGAIKGLFIKIFWYKYVIRMTANVEQIVRNIFRFISYTIQDILMIHRKVYLFCSNIAYSLVQPITRLLTNYFDKYFPSVQKYLIKNLENIKIFVDQTLNQIFTTYIQLKKFTKLFFLSNTFNIVDKTIEIVKSTLGAIMSGSFDFLKHEKEIKNLYNNIIKTLEKISQTIIIKLEKVMNEVDSNLSFVAGDKFFKIIAKSLTSVSSYVIDQLKDEENQKYFRSAIYSSIVYPFDDLRDKIRDFTMGSIWPYYIVMDLEKDQKLNSIDEFKVTVRFTSPVPFNDFKSLPDFAYVTRKINKIKSTTQSIKEIIKSQLTNGWKYFELRNWFTMYVPRTSFTSILPEFESYATISKRSVMTFDKKSFTLTPDSCRVLLSKDLKFKKWEIIMNQQKNNQFFIVNIGSNTFEISGSSYKVNLNGKPSDLPIHIGSTSLIGLGRMMKLKDDKLGLTITIDPLNEMFTVGISGWYHGKVRGLFGNSDNEPFNDFMLDNEKLVTSEMFVKEISYKGQSCKILADNNQTPMKPVKNCPFIRRMVCKFLYLCPFSPLAACFNKVDPKKFLEMCVNSNEEVLTKLDPFVCRSVRNYQAQCQKAGVKISVPPPCQKCNVPNDTPLSLNEFRNVKVKEKVSDIVFLVDEGTCLNSLHDKLQNIVTGLEKEMKTKGINSINYGLVTFVDDHSRQANFHTVGQKLFGSSQEMIMSLKTLKSSNGRFKDLIGAITTAANYPFREHASRHLVMISCSSTKEYPNVLQTLADTLQKKAIHFSLLTDFSFKLKDENKKSIIFGVDSKNIYTALSRNGDKNLTARPETDFLYQLTLKLKGVVFDYKFLTINQELTKNRFVNSLANQISQRATPARSSRCTCVDDGEYNCIPLDTHTIFPVKRT